jgi:long-chain acyl-CoA synthetase
MYGQTEATARLSYLPPHDLQTKLGSIGKGIPSVTLKVVDENNNPVKPGVSGEIIASGDNIMKGYFKDKELTSETIRNGWLYTGDIATVDEDGFIFVVSRKKEIIKVGGKRVSPKEIEEVILMIPEVVDCTILGVEDPILGESIKAIITLNDEGKNKIAANDILNHCHKHLSIHKVPSQIEFESSINMSATGKKVKKTS